MEIVLESDVRLLKHQSCRLNPGVKEKVNKEIEKMLATDLIFLVDEVEWVSPVVIQDKKYLDDIRVCIYYWRLNNAYTHDLFPTPFSDEVLYSFIGNEA